MDASEFRRPLAGPASPAAPGARHSSSAASAASPRDESRKRSFSSVDQHSPFSDELAGSAANRRKSQKVSRACDFCKQRKAKCSGTIPCDKCTRKGLACVYDAKYSRGRPPTPPPSAAWSSGASAASHPGAVSASGPEEPSVLYQTTEASGPNAAPASSRSLRGRVRDSQGPASRASPELGMAEIQGQIFDPTSGVTFLHRAWKRLSKHDSSIVPDEPSASTESQPLMLAGDKPLPTITDDDVAKLCLPEPRELQDLLALYFDVCIATYRVLHRPSVMAWLQIMVDNLRQGKPVWQDIGRAKASIVLTALAVSTAHQEKSNGFHSSEDETLSLARSDRLFCVALQLTERETGLPRLESAQSRLIHVLYLLTTSRMNRAWYTFGNALQIISALGMHRKAAKKRHLAPGSSDYIQAQCRMRTFWTAYVLDKYLGVIFGRPRHFHDDDIDQDYPDRIDDEDMTAQGPVERSEENPDCHIDALIFHAKIAQIIGNTSREVYSIKPISERERVAAAHRLSERIHEWRAGLPPHLGSIRPSMLIPSFRRQATVLKLAYSHAIMHANRLFLLGNLSSGSEMQILECIGAARTVLETVDGMAAEGPIFHAFWWTQYVTFCALLVTYVWDIQQKRRGIFLEGEGKTKHAKLMDLAERCQTHLAHATASNSPSRRYAIILEEFRTEGLGQMSRKSQAPSQPPRVSATRPAGPSTEAPVLPQQSQENGAAAAAAMADGFDFDPAYAAESGAVDLMGQGDAGFLGSNLLDEWQTTDWLELDSSAFGPYMDIDANALAWMPDIGG
ncbi:fungal specific transcription factor domain-containing protein [Colletotrichum tofieldiae]|uniref:Fungal specific transcription factor domain-containing protein n=1 Tax=Colletotrichum tofieldiae TaxID=708197 RepID=A0A166YNR8_9PEZI|nr:fungal specific transcription factor domain-containing protein [Colletotrichum tofieldiae]GKT59727.1 fungal specific transcription factor domain-containing protein [Colletotrichum tofieldiae]GKT78527.1 fungal specific transcription factor domain-containing protein [Colletotrichum tofieldiae]GKT85897.1 fungal specific transcription factor domain-containing protein [Colletotrichum tofieldiae]